MPIIAKETGGGDFIPAPVGVHQAVCVDVVDLGSVDSTYNGKTKSQHKVRVVWEIEETMETGKRFTVNRRYTLSLNEKASLRRDLEGWRGRPFDESELKGFDVEKLLGANCMVNIVHSPPQPGKSPFANVAAIMPIHKGMTKMVGSLEYIRVKDRTSANGDAKEPDDDPSNFDPTDSDVPF